MNKTIKSLKLSFIVVVALSLCSFSINNGNENKKKTKRPKPEVIQAINDSICAEGYNLYVAEMVNWISTDSVMAHCSRDEWDGNVIWQPTDSTWCAIFYDEDAKNCVFEMHLNCIDHSMSFSYDKHPITEAQLVQIKLRQVMLNNVLEKYGDMIRYNKNIGNPNWDFVRINDNLIRLYILQGTVHPNMIPFGNDYSIDLDNNGNALCFRKYHNSLIAVNTVDGEGNSVESVMHSHLPDNPYITPTDVCNFLLYGGPLKAHYIFSTGLDGYIVHSAKNNSAIFLTQKMMKKNK